MPWGRRCGNDPVVAARPGDNTRHIHPTPAVTLRNPAVPRTPPVPVRQRTGAAPPRLAGVVDAAGWAWVTAGSGAVSCPDGAR